MWNPLCSNPCWVIIATCSWHALSLCILQSLCFYSIFCSNGLLLPYTEWVWLTISTHCQLSSKQDHWSTSTTWKIYSSENILVMLSIEPGQLSLKASMLPLCYAVVKSPTRNDVVAENTVVSLPYVCQFCHSYTAEAAPVKQNSIPFVLMSNEQ